MLSETLTLTGLDGSGTIQQDVAFEKFSEDRVNGSEYMQTSSNPSRPFTLKVRHQLAKPGVAGFDRHNLSLTCYSQNRDTEGANVGNPVPVTANVTIQVPRALALGTDQVPLVDPAASVLCLLCTALISVSGGRIDGATYTPSAFMRDFLSGMY